MILRKRNSQYARWDKENDKWIVGNIEYQWYTNEEKSASPIYSELTEALEWIIKHDENIS